jgi:hypothetical protein
LKIIPKDLTPLYKNLKTNGTTIYAFPGAEEDINQQSDNYKMYFSKFVLLNLPEVQTALDDEPKKWDFVNAFYSASDQESPTFAERTVNSLRNYVANQEVTIRGTKVSENEYFYDNSVLQTNTEKVFWKWCKKLGLIQFEAAVDGDEYFGNLDEFTSNNPSDTEYFPEYLWKEREVSDNNISKFYESPTESNKLEVEYEGTINYKVGDFVEFFDVENVTFPNIAKYAEVIGVLEPSGSNGYRVIFDIECTESEQIENAGYSRLVYNKLVRYIGEILGNNNVVSQNLAFDQIFASVPDNAGETPDILFRTRFDSNYSPDLQFPILPSQYQPEIKGAENFNSPIVQNPTNYPGDQYAQYDNDNNLNEYTYITKTGDILRRSGEYFGVSGDINNVSLNGETIDGVQLDFNPDHYVKMNVLGDEVSNFDEFNTRQINGEFPNDFKFNAVLWYYNVEDINGNIATNLYGISFLDNPANDPVETGTRFPQLTKLAANDNQDGTSYQFSLNKHTTITPDNPQPTFSNEYINNLFGMNLFNEVMKRLVVFNDSALKIITDNQKLSESVDDLKQLIYTQTDIDTINQQINQLNQLLQLYSTNQIVTTSSIRVVNNNSVSPPEIQLFNVEGRYIEITNIDTTNLYDSDGYIPFSIGVPEGKDFLVNVNNNDTTEQILPDNEVLTIYLNRDLDYKQTVDFFVNGSGDSTENKKLNILVTYNDGQGIPTLRNLVTELDLPVYYNSVIQDQNTSFSWKQINQDLTQFRLNNDGETIGMSASRVSGLQPGDTILIENVIFDTISIDGQYPIDSIDGNTINIDYTENTNLNSYIVQEISDGNLSSGDIISEYNSMGTFRFNKGYKISITRVDELDTSTFEDRYKTYITPLN